MFGSLCTMDCTNCPVADECLMEGCYLGDEYGEDEDEC